VNSRPASVCAGPRTCDLPRPAGQTRTSKRCVSALTFQLQGCCSILRSDTGQRYPLTRAAVQLNAAGSLANTLAGCALLGNARHAADARLGLAPERTRVAMAGPIGDDHLGHFFRSHFAKTGVQWIERALPSAGTGTVIVLSTPDAQRSFLSYPGPPQPLAFSEATKAAIAASRCLVIEGYLWELPRAAAAIDEAIRLARSAGRTVAMTCADVSVVARFRREMLVAARGADVLFTNAAEARALVGDDRLCRAAGASAVVERDASMQDAEDAALQLGQVCPVAVVTDGSRGSCITALGQLHVVPPHWALEPPVDTCGAGDAYAAGFLHGYLTGMPVRAMGDFAAATASAVISHKGPQLLPEHAAQLAACRPMRVEAPYAEADALDEGALWSSSHEWRCQAAL
jgi:sugar/nucleoside kinase (ribokinase family)